MSMKSKIVGCLASVVLLSGLNVSQVSADDLNTISNSEIENAKKELELLNETIDVKVNEKGNLDSALFELKSEQEKLNNKLNFLLVHLDKKEKEVIEYNEELSELKNGIVETNIMLDEREDEFKTRINFLYKEHMGNDTKLIEVILNSDGFFKLVNNLISYKKIVGKDNEVVLKYVGLIQKLEDDTKAVEKVIKKINEKVKEVEGLIEDVEKTIGEKVEVEYLLKNKIEENNKILKSLDSKLSSKEEEILKLIEEEKERIEKERLEKIKLEELMKSSFSNNSNDKGKKAINGKDNNVTSYTDIEKLDFDGDADFKKYLKSVNWMRSQVGKENLDEYYRIIDKYSEQVGLPSALVKGLIMTESTFQKSTTNVNRNGTIDRGLMQMNSNTAPGVAKSLGLTYEVGMEFIPDTNIKMGTYYMKKHYTPENLHEGLTSYNRGPTGAKNWYIKHGTYESEYSKKVIGYMKVFLKEEGN